MTPLALNLEDLEAFVTVAVAGSFRQAAALLGTSQPTVTNRIQRLEACLGLKLFSRSTRRVSLTEAGAQLLPQAERSIESLGSLVADARDQADLKRGRVAIGASPTVAAALLIPVLRKFMNQYPEVQVRLTDDFRAPLLEKLHAGDLDLTILPMDGRTADFSCDLLFSENLRIVAPRSFAIATNRSYSFAELSGYPFVSMPSPSLMHAALVEGFAMQGRKFRPVIEVNNQVTLLGLIESGVGLSMLPDMWIHSSLLSSMDVLKVTDLQKRRQISLVTSRHRALSPAASALARMVKSTLKQAKPVGKAPIGIDRKS